MTLDSCCRQNAEDYAKVSLRGIHDHCCGNASRHTGPVLDTGPVSRTGRCRLPGFLHCRSQHYRLLCSLVPTLTFLDCGFRRNDGAALHHNPPSLVPAPAMGFATNTQDLGKEWCLRRSRESWNLRWPARCCGSRACPEPVEGPHHERSAEVEPLTRPGRRPRRYTGPPRRRLPRCRAT